MKITKNYLNLSSNDTSEVKVDLQYQELHFTPQNWNIPQTVIVSGVDDSFIDGDQLTQISVGVKENSDPNFISEPNQSVDVLNIGTSSLLPIVYDSVVINSSNL